MRRLAKIAEVITEDDGTPNIILPETAQEEQHEGRVIRVGPGRYSESGALIPMDIVRGDCVLFPTHAGYSVGAEADELVIMTADDVLAVRDAIDR